MSRMVNRTGPAASAVLDPAGWLGRRLERNFDRLESDQYAPAAADAERKGIFQSTDYSWPGDTEGRCLLAWVLLQRATGRRAEWLDQAVRRLDEFTNERGYFGPIAATEVHREQQLASHGWVLRALCELWLDTADQSVLARIRRIVEYLALPTAGAHRLYPIDPAQRTRDVGTFEGEEVAHLGQWIVSTDVGCDLIFLDGLAQAATVLADDIGKQAAVIVEEIIERFAQMDLTALHAQTHATLTGCRALVRWYDHTNRVELLERAEQVFDLYRTVAMSETHGNWNWFGRPSHTEPCAIVDAFMIACQLWQRRGGPERLEQAHEILFNGLSHGQRRNGGFGCDSIVGADSLDPDALTVKTEEAWWCCTMRGAEGLSAAAEYAVSGEFGRLRIALPTSGTFTQTNSSGDTLVWRVDSTYPVEGSTCVRLLSAPGELALEIDVFLPSSARNPFVTVEGAARAFRIDDGFIHTRVRLAPGDSVEFGYDLELRLVAPHNAASDPERRAVARGPLLYGAETDDTIGSLAELEWDAADGVVLAGSHRLTPIDDVLDRSLPPDYRRQVLFPTR